MITSTSNSRIKQIRKLKEHKERLQTGNYFVEGLRIVGEAFEQGAQFEYLIYSPDLLTSEFGWKIIQFFKEKNMEVLETSKEVLKTFQQRMVLKESLRFFRKKNFTSGPAFRKRGFLDCAGLNSGPWQFGNYPENQ